MLLKLAAFKAEHGHCRVTMKIDPKLSGWVDKQRMHKRRLNAGDSNPVKRGITAERVAKLDAIGFEWSPPLGSTDEAGWEAMLSKLVAFKAEHDHCRVPHRHPADPKLGGWVASQRRCKRRLDAGEPNPHITAGRVAKLEALGFDWSPPNLGGTIDEAGWETMRAKLAAFKAEHGHCRVLNRHPADPKLGRWVASQRQCKRRLDAGDSNPNITAGRVAKLEAIGFDWVVTLNKKR